MSQRSKSLPTIQEFFATENRTLFVATVVGLPTPVVAGAANLDLPQL